MGQFPLHPFIVWVVHALGFCAGAIGTETDGSIVSPAAMNGIVGIKPSVGLVSRAGIVPISASQDTAGPMTRSVRDGVLVLATIAGSDARDTITAAAGIDFSDLEASLDSFSLRGVRLGVARTYADYHDRVDALLEDALEALREAGAEIVDQVELTAAGTIREHERIVMEYEFKQGLNAYLAERDDRTLVRSLADVIDFNEAHAGTVMPHFHQDILHSAEARGSLTDAAYLEARAQSLELAARDGMDAALSTHRLDALVAPTTSPAWLIDWVCGDNRKGSAACPPAVCGYPHVTVPMGFVEHLPVGLSIFSGAFRDCDVLRIAHAFESATGHRRAPPVHS
jgi:amidase